MWVVLDCPCAYISALSGDVAQLVEHLLCKQGVGGSSPLVSTGNRQVIPDISPPVT